MTEPNKPQRRRSRKPDGKYQEGNGVNTHLEATEITDAVGKKEIDYSVKQKVDGTSQDSAGKYGKSKKVTQPTFGKVYTVNN